MYVDVHYRLLGYYILDINLESIHLQCNKSKCTVTCEPVIIFQLLLSTSILVSLATMSTTVTTAPTRTVEAKINYYPPDGPKVFYPGTAGYQRRNFDTRSVPINDIRGSEDLFSLDKNGFQVVKNNWTEIGLNDHKEKVESIVYPETIDMLKRV